MFNLKILKDKDAQIKIFQVSLFVLFFTLILFSSSVFSAGEDWIIDGERIYTDTDKVYISFDQHTATKSGWYYGDLISKVYEGYVDFAFGFDSELAGISQVQINNPRWFNNTKSYTCPTNYFDYNSTHAWCYENITTYSAPNITNGSYLKLLFERDFEWGNVSTKTIYWNESYIEEWQDFSNMNYADFEYQGTNKWYYNKNVPIIQDKEYRFRFYMDVIPRLGTNSGKYWFAIKPSSESLSQAVSSGHLYALDPWFNSTFGNRITYNVDPAEETLDNFTRLFNITCEDGMECNLWAGIDIVDGNCSDDGTNDLSFEYDKRTANESVLTWVKLPEYSDTGQHSICVYFNETVATSHVDQINAWDKNYTAVFHFQSFEGTNTIINSKNPSGGFGVMIGDGISYEAGIMGDALHVSGSDDYLTSSFLLNGSAPFTWEVWGYTDSLASIVSYIQSGAGAGGYRLHYIYTDGDYTMGIQAVDEDRSGLTVSTGQWTYLGDTFETGDLDQYVDKLVSNSAYASSPANIGNLSVGGPSTDVTGEFDEVRISDIKRSNAWINASQDNTDYTMVSKESVESFTESADTTPPYFSILPDDKIINYTQAFGIQFNGTDADSEPVSYVINWTGYFSINQSGWLQNETHLGAGTYNINVSINDSEDNFNSTFYELIINESVPEGSLASNLGWSINEGQEVIISLTETNYGDGDVAYIVNRDDVAKGTGETWTPAYGTYDYVLNTTGGLNWTINRSMDTQTLIVNDDLFPKIDFSYPLNNSNLSLNEFTINITIIELNPNDCIWSNDSFTTNHSITCGDNITAIWEQGINNVNYWIDDLDGNENRTSITFFSDSIFPKIDFSYPPNNSNLSIIEFTINITIIELNAANCVWTNDSFAVNHSITCGDNITAIWQDGINNVSYWVNDSVGNENRTSVTFYAASENLNGSQGEVYWIRNHSDIKNVSNSDYIFFNNTGDSEHSVQVFNLTNAYIYYLDGSSTSQIGNATNISLNSNGNYSYVLNRFNVTDNNFRENSPISLQRINYNDIEVDSTIKSSNILVYIHHRCSEVVGVDYIKLNTGSVTQSFTCSNDVVSLTISEILVASSNQYIKLRTSLVSSGGSGGGSSSSGPLPKSVVSADLVYSINISSKRDFKFDVKNSIIVEVFNKSNKLIDVEKINISIIDNIDYSSFDTIRRSKGIYKKDFIINKDKIEEFEIKVKIFDKGSLITQTKTFIITNPILLDVIVDKSKSNLSRLAELIEDNWLLILFWASVVIGFIVILFLIKAIRE